MFSEDLHSPDPPDWEQVPIRSTPLQWGGCDENGDGDGDGDRRDARAASGSGRRERVGAGCLPLCLVRGVPRAPETWSICRAVA